MKPSAKSVEVTKLSGFVAEQIEVEREKLRMHQIDALLGVRQRDVGRSDQAERSADRRKRAVASHMVGVRNSDVEPAAP